MKKFLILLLVLISLNASKSFAQDNNVSSRSSAIEVEYFLPYPGILPDSPLYFLKALRDRTISFFISDPLKKAEFNLLMSDVRLNAAQYLFAKGEGKYGLAETTVSKAENYFFNSLVILNSAKQQGMQVDDFSAKLITAAKKHQQIIRELKDKSKGAIRERLTEDEKRAHDYEIRASDFKLKQ
jgi:hypothetical protein